ncbi:hypothetical protein T4A_1458 [Trichinella pseudospiralis]|uniref:Uncharacterized protein n=1 Tax=Trichinella pseudospiralis TaxID=6337 RepID=A0A0V1DWL4_TRIPS|nr:hypothetical protein T4E_2410 [Trichinella pseudospiralis]KRY65490.1 hypothetical protein T4A_1458 [Trichinella pseudospiralis]KRZ26220.1 hypothetical protein T4C_13916 [Trichinella pseudospiralis]
MKDQCFMPADDYILPIISSDGDHKGCESGLTTNVDVTAVLRRIPHGDFCPMDEETAY